MRHNKSHKKQTEENYEKDTKASHSKEEESITRQKSSISEFIERPLPTEDEVAEFEEMIEEEARDEEIEESLNEIYYDGGEDVVDVSKLDIKKKRGILFWFMFLIVGGGLLAGLLIFGYSYFYNLGSDATAVEITVDGPEKVTAGEEFFYEVKYRNLSNVNLQDVKIEVFYPDGFIFLDSSPMMNNLNTEENKKKEFLSWDFDALGAHSSGTIKIKAKILGEKDKICIIPIKMRYMPENFSSEFKKETENSIVVKGIGLDFDIDYAPTVLIGEENEMEIIFTRQEDSFLNDIQLVVESDENLEITDIIPEEGSELYVGEIKNKSAEISGFTDKAQMLKLKYKLNQKLYDKQILKLLFKTLEVEEEKSYIIYEEEFELETMKSDLNLGLIVNGSKNDSSVDFGERMNYSITYANKGDSNMKDVVIMVVLEGDFFDWTTLNDELGGVEKGNTISWSKEEIPILEELPVNAEGVIDFSIDIANFKETNKDDVLLRSYAQFSIGNIEDFKENIDNRSNAIAHRINSDLDLKEEIKYFDDDNIPVGSGPLPPKVNEVTNFKVYWTLTNNLHELKGARATLELPDYISWGGKNRTSVGEITYNKSEHAVVWNIGRLPTSVYRADAEFNIEITPQEGDKGKILVLLPGTTIEATDNVTDDFITKKTTPKTTRLEDDTIASMNNDGRVE